jgi:MFS transporter, DHA2 family, multidrug resistance protein
MTDTAPRAGRREWIALVALMLPLLLISMDTTVLLYAVPRISADLRPSTTELLWILDIYGFVLAGLLVTMGSLGDRIGRRRLLLLGAGAFGVASAISAYSPSAAVLIGTRALLGIGGATLMPSTMALVRNMFHDAKQRQAALGVWMATFTSGIAVGPLVGGVLLNHFWWGSVFLINVPVMLLLLAIGPVLLPESRDPRPGRFDPVSVLLSLAAVLPTIYGIKRAAQDGFGVLPAVAIIAGLAIGVAFVHRQRRPDPMIDVRLFGRRTFSAAVLVNVLATFVMIGYALFTTQYLQLVLGYSPLKAALVSLPTTLLVAGAASAVGMLARALRPAYVMAGGLVVAAGGLVVLAGLRADSGVLYLLTGASLLATGVVAAMTLTAEMVLASAPPERAGAASALSETANEFGGALGFALLGSLGGAIYRQHVAAHVPSTLPAGARAAATDTLGGAAGVAAGQPGQAGTALLHAARVAFTDGFNVTALVGAVVLVLAAVLAAVLLRTVVPARKTGSAVPAPISEAAGTPAGRV